MKHINGLLNFLVVLFSRGSPKKVIPSIFPINIVPIDDVEVRVVLPIELRGLSVKERDEKVRSTLRKALQTVQATLDNLDSVRYNYGQ